MKPLAQDYLRLRFQLVVGSLALGLVSLLGTLWYRLVEGFSWVDALYMTLITLSTVGFGEIEPLGPRGRAFTVVLILLGLISIGYIVNRFTEAVIQGHFQEHIRWRRQQQQMDSLSQHYLICGFGRIGRQVALEFAAEGIPFVVIDIASNIIAAAQEYGYICLEGDATHDATLLEAGVERAIGLITVLPSDAENLYVVLSARTLNSKLRTIARANNQEALAKLQRAGASSVISPYISGAKRMVAAALRPQVMDFVDGILSGTNRTYYLEEFRLDIDQCSLVGQTLGETGLRAKSGALVIAIRRRDGTIVGGPDAQTPLLAEDLLICMGSSDQLRRLEQLIYPLDSQTRGSY
ncbi:MAG: potassium channel protein [Synechococcaceae cyanobacterium RM1_1_27]|nr:potassium channel protein [Synechococcaceae cyanobacterium SM2_3_2]NJO86209.1 potassium channel protein [Synechococcaceae cyanobacterium RM1_1_27]